VVARPDELMVHASDGAAAMSPVALALHQSGAAVKSLTLRTPTLDDVFLHLTGSHLEGDESAASSPDDGADRAPARPPASATPSTADSGGHP
jgi:ABC-2 type transport system ATP-binding protein